MTADSDHIEAAAGHLSAVLGGLLGELSAPELYVVLGEVKALSCLLPDLVDCLADAVVYRSALGRVCDDRGVDVDAVATSADVAVALRAAVVQLQAVVGPLADALDGLGHLAES